jgi:Fe-S cluster biogenesis protein NfuA
VIADEAEATARRVDGLLAELRGGPDPRAAAVAEELTRCLVQLYGTGLARIVAGIGPRLSAEICADPLVESLLLVHDLHPLDTDTRVRQAVARAWPGPGEVRYLGIDAAGVAHLRLTAGRSGCGSSRQTGPGEVEAIVRQAAPELTDVHVEVPAAALPLLQVSLRQGLGPPARPPVAADIGP